MKALLAGAPLFAADLWTRRRTILQLGIDDFRKQYIGSALGILWAVLKPAVHVVSLWLIFSVGFRQGRSGTYPFVLYLLSGTCVWQFVSEALAKGTQAVTENSHLVKKVVFPLEFLPVVRLLSSLLFHLVFLGLVAVVSILSGHPPGLAVLQLPYYLLAGVALLLGTVWATSALRVFLKDVGEIVQILLLMGFWLTPIFWDVRSFSPTVAFFLKLNPAYYLVNGYRESLYGGAWFWEHPALTAYFWGMTALLLVGGAAIFRKLRPHFADVL